MRKLIIIVSIFFVLVVGIILINNLLSYKPKGIDPAPLYYLELPDDLDVCSIISYNDSVLAKKYNCKCREPEGRGGDCLLLSIPVNDTNRYAGRNILIIQFENHSDAINRYLFCKEGTKTNSIIYKEGKRYKSGYFMAYVPISTDIQHGIPVIDNGIRLNFGFLVNNYFITISYRDFSAKSKETYKDNINNDIILVSKLFNDVLEKYKEINTDKE